MRRTLVGTLCAVLLTGAATMASADPDPYIGDPVRLCDMVAIEDTPTGTGEVVLPSQDPESLTDTELYTCGKSISSGRTTFAADDDPVDTDVVAGTVSSSWQISNLTGRRQVVIQTRVQAAGLNQFRDFRAVYRVTYKEPGEAAVTINVTVDISHEAGPVQGTGSVFGKEAFTQVLGGIPVGATVTVDLLKDSTGRVRDIAAGDPPRFKPLEVKRSRQIGPTRTIAP